MNLIHMKCHNCGSNLDLDLDNLIAFCPYCGEKLLIDIEKFNEVLVAKEQTKQKQLDHEYSLKEKKLAIQREDKHTKISLVIAAILIIGMIILSIHLNYL